MYPSVVHSSECNSEVRSSLPGTAKAKRVASGTLPTIALNAILLIATTVPSYADEELSYPNISGELSIEVQDDFTFRSDDPNQELNDIYTTTELVTNFHFSPTVSLVTHLTFEPVEDPTGDRFFGDQGVYVEELFLAYDGEQVGVFAGKFDPAFGLAWDATPGIYGTDLAEDYQLVERIGAGFYVPFELGGSEHVFMLSSFFADTTILSESAIKNRGRTDRSDGGASNTESFNSFSATMDGGIPATPLNYNLGIRYQSGGEGDPEDETGFVAGINGEHQVNDDFSIEGIAEVAYFNNFDAQDGDAFYGTIGLQYNFDQFFATTSYTLRDGDDTGTTDHHAQVSVGYVHETGLGIEVGYRFNRIEREDAHTVGALVTYGIAF